MATNGTLGVSLGPAATTNTLGPAAMTNTLGAAAPTAALPYPQPTPQWTQPLPTAQTNVALNPGIIPQPAPMPINPTPGYTAPPTPTFTGHAPTPTPYGDFAGLDPATFNRSPDSIYLQGQAQNALQRSAAARGTLLTGGLQKSLQSNAVGLAAQDFGNAYNRALSTYTTNRDTNQQNFGQGLASYEGNLAGFKANADTGLGYGHLGLDTQQSTFGQNEQRGRDVQANQQGQNDYNAAQSTLAAQNYANQVEAMRAQNAAESARIASPQARSISASRYARPVLGGR